ncbi:unnamed protein product [Onchocerca flexuosa]|uniref:SPX domain-containing protein n=1 Tax=Onchocerca flexuosa TaxID=387005 RepID=A0A183I209_9BILA|nr:unnamed protein product [Onchocerca flexuosa]
MSRIEFDSYYSVFGEIHFKDNLKFYVKLLSKELAILQQKNLKYEKVKEADDKVNKGLLRQV